MIIKRIQLSNSDEEELLTLLELMVYFKMSYPTGFHSTCEVQLDDKEAKILTPEVTYCMDEYTYYSLYLKSNEMIAAMYKEVHEKENKY